MTLTRLSMIIIRWNTFSQADDSPKQESSILRREPRVAWRLPGEAHTAASRTGSGASGMKITQQIMAPRAGQTVVLRISGFLNISNKIRI